MDWAKMPLERLFVFIAALIPGSSVLLVVALHRSSLWKQFWDLNYLGYQSKIAALVFAAFVAGLTVNEMVAFLINFIVGFTVSFKAAYRKSRDAALASASGKGPQPSQPLPAQPVEQQFSPWRSQNWRKLLGSYLGDAAPENVALADDPELVNDGLWQEWWNLLDRLATPKTNRQREMVVNVEVNFGGACLIVLVSAPWTPVLRAWWIIAPCLFWVLITTTFSRQQYQNAKGLDYSYYKQMEYLQMRVCNSEQADDDGQ